MPAPPLGPDRVLDVLGATSALGGLVTVGAVAAPHQDHTWDVQAAAVGVAFVVTGACLHFVRARTATSVHVACAVLSLGVLLLTWFGMRDLGGVPAVFLLLLTGVAASVGGWAAPVVLLLGQSAGYAVVLATARVELRLDRASQWLVVSLGLGIALLHQRHVRTQLLAAHARDLCVRAEREEERLQHALRLQRVDEELRMTDELQSGFVAMASHELRTPLTAIGGFARTMLDRWDTLADADKHSYVTIIDEQSERLARLVSDLLLLSRIEQGQVNGTPRSLSLREVIERVIDELAEAGEIAVTCPDHARVHGDEEHLHQLVRNLLANAHTHGAAPVAVDVDLDDDAAVLRVRDAGPGVPPEFVDRLFARFSRLPHPDGRHSPGSTGLGLAIVSGLTAAVGGTAWYEPGAPAGATFCVRLPLVADVPAQEAGAFRGGGG